MEDIQCSSEAGTQGHTAPIPNQKTSAGRPVQLECIRAFIWPNVHCPGVDTMLLVHIQKLLGCLCLQSHWRLLLQQLHKTKCAIHQMVPHRHCIQLHVTSTTKVIPSFMHKTYANVNILSHNCVWLVQLRMLCCRMTVTKHQEKSSSTLTDCLQLQMVEVAYLIYCGRYFYPVLVLSLFLVSAGLLIRTLRRQRKKIMALVNECRLTPLVWDGWVRAISSHRLLPGDVMVLQPGKALCDMVLLQGTCLVMESMLSGEVSAHTSGFTKIRSHQVKSDQVCLHQKRCIS